MVTKSATRGRPRTLPKGRKILAFMPEEMIAGLDAMALLQGVSRAHLIRRFVRIGLLRHTRAAEGAANATEEDVGRARSAAKRKGLVR